MIRSARPNSLVPVGRLALVCLILSLAFSLVACGPWPSEDDADSSPVHVEIRALVDDYLEDYLQLFPTRATAAGDHRADRSLENLTPERIAAWLEHNREVQAELEAFLAEEGQDPDLRLDAESVLRQAASTLFDYEKRDVLRQSPLFWSGLLGNVSVFLLVREDLPLEDRLDALAERVDAVPRLCEQAADWLGQGVPERLSKELTEMAASQIAAGGTFYENGLVDAASSLEGERGEAIRARLAEVAGPAAEAHRLLAERLTELAETATGDPRLGEFYDENFRLSTGMDEPVDVILERAEADLVRKREETATFCRSIWTEIVGEDGEEAPEDEKAVIRACFARIAQDNAGSLAPFVEHYQRLTEDAQRFVEEHEILTPPGELTLKVGISPPFLAGQSVGGIYPAGPFAPEADALLFVPAVPDDAPEELKKAFYGDFNDHFNVMITPHETIPGHYAQGKYSARGPSKIRAVFYNSVYAEGWGTFSERLMLDHGWGDGLARVAHLKKQLENIARTIVDIRVNRKDMDRESMLTFLREEAMQDGQFAANMWTRAITWSPQLTSYYLGYRDIYELYEAWRVQHPDAAPKEFSDPMMSLGSVPVRHYRDMWAAQGVTMDPPS